MKSTEGLTRRPQIMIVIAIGAVAVLTAVYAIVVGAGNGSADPDIARSPLDSACVPPALDGTTVVVSLSDDGSTEGQHSRTGSGEAMTLSVDRQVADQGTVSFLAENDGTLTHELVILPLPDAAAAGSRPTGEDLMVDQTALVGEASNSCGDGPGEGVAPGSSSWDTDHATRSV